MRSSVIGLTLVLLATAPATDPLATGEESRRTCPRGSATVAENDRARVYKVRDRHSRRGFAVDGCDRRSGNLYPIDLPASDIYAFLGRAVSLRGTVVGYATQLCGPNGHPEDPALNSCFPSVRVVDLAVGPRVADESLNASPAGPRRRRLVKVGSLQAKPDGAVAWIACPERNRTRAIGLQRPNCVRAGDYNYVFADDGRRRRLLDRGRGLEPRSLRLAGSTLSWTKNGRRKRATLRAVDR